MVDTYEMDAARRCQLRAGWIRDEVVVLNDSSWLVLADQLVAESVATERLDHTCLD